MNNLTVLTISYGSLDLLDLMARSVRKTSDCDVLICDNKGDVNLSYPNVKIIKNKPSMTGGSNQHGESINRMLPSVKTPYVAIIESDMFVLPGWNDIGSYDAILSKKTDRLYHMCFAIMKTNIARQIDFRAGKNDKDRASGKSYPVKYDVGWQMSRIKDNVKLVNFVDCKSGAGIYFGSSFQSDEFHTDTGRCIACHCGRGSNIGGKSIRKGYDHPKKQLQRWKQIAEVLIK